MTTVGVVVGICRGHDAISAAAAGQIRLLQGLPGVDRVVLFTTSFERADVDAEVVVVPDAWALLRHTSFAACDALVFHWGIYTPLFDALWITDPRRCAVHFHNVTPPEFAGPESQPVLHLSQLQLEAVRTIPIDVWTYSEFNRRTLIEMGVPEERIRFVPFVIEPPRALVASRHPDVVTMLCVGRFVPAKGVHVLVEAAALLDADLPPWRLVIAGNADMSDTTYLAALVAAVFEHGLEQHVSFAHPDGEELWQLFEGADILVSPSFHEGLCVPVIEGYLAGCRVVASDGGNLQYLVQPPDPIVPAGDAPALAAAMASVVREIRSDGGTARRPAVDALIARFSEPLARAQLAQELARRLGG